MLALACLVALAGCGSSPTQTTISSTPTWAAASGAPDVSAATTKGWSQYRDPTYGFVVEFPSGATISPTAGQSGNNTVSWRFPNPQVSSDIATLEVTTTAHASVGLCANMTQGKPVKLNDGITGYETNNLSTADSTTHQPQIAVVFTHSGLLSIISLTGQESTDAFEQHWGGAWGHILSSFHAGKSPTAGQPCA